ncbi:hypothetical protein GSB9_03375 [Flavobacteriaceae bacterium GSB9]|nr:hypothetical protein GSB9_03375 [Flavobacteriaceae bacterium GSB9]
METNTKKKNRTLFFKRTFIIIANGLGYDYVAEKSAGLFRRKTKIIKVKGFSDRKIRRNEL